MKKLTKNESAPIFQISLRWHSLANILLQGEKVNRNDLVFFTIEKWFLAMGCNFVKN